MATLAPIQNWKPRHDIVVALHCSGDTNIEIAEKTGYTEVRVSQILNDPQARERIRRFQKRIEQKMHEDIGGSVLKLAQKSLRNISKTVDADIPVSAVSAKKHQDKVGLELLGIVGYTKNSEGKRGDARPALDRDIQERLVSAVEKSEEAKRLREVTDEVEVVESSNGGSPNE